MPFLVLVAMGVVAISRESFWIDEAFSGQLARQPSLQAWWTVLLGNKLNDVQMPLYVGYLWLFARVFGVGEWCLRMAGLPWFICGAFFFVSAFRSRRQRFFALCAVGLSPFGWYYLNEARPYAMQVGGALLIAAALIRLQWDETRDGCWLGCYLAGLLIVSGSSMLGMIWAAPTVLAFVVMPRARLLQWAGRYRVGLILGLLAFLGLGGYYLWTMSLGARASSAATTTWQSTGFVFYELMGLVGLGPGRLELREARVSTFIPFLPLLAAQCALLAVVARAAMLDLAGVGTSRVRLMAIVLGLPLLFILGAGVMLHFRVLGRHFSPLLPVYLFGVVLGCERLVRREGFWRRGAVIAFLALNLLACLSIRFSARHAKDDYRLAARIALEGLARNERVWWNAAPVGAEFYNLPLTSNVFASGSAILVENPKKPLADSLPTPVLVLRSKPDIFDREGLIAAYLERMGVREESRFQAFQVLRKGQGPAAAPLPPAR